MFRGDRNDKRAKGGSIIYVNNNIACSRLDSFDCNDSLAVLLDLPRYQIAIACIYRSPSITYNDNMKMIDQIKNLKTLILSGIEVMIVGDFNLPEVLWDSGSVVSPQATNNKQLLIQRKFLDTFQDTGLYWQLSDGTVTRRRLYNGSLQESLLDQVLISDPALILQCKIISQLGKSDHNGIVSTVRCENLPGYISSQRKCWGKITLEELSDIGSTVDWSYHGESAVESIWSHIDERLNIISDNVPTVKMETSQNGATYMRSPWECTTLARKRRIKNMAWQVFEESPTNDNLMYALEKNNELENAITKEMMKYEAKMTSGMKKNPKSFYRYVNSKRKLKQSVVSVKTKTGHLAKSPQETANLLAEFFETTFQNSGSDIKDKYPTEPNETDIRPITTDEVAKLLSDLNVYKSMGPDGIHAKVLKSLSNNTDFVACVELLFNSCLNQGQVPEVWKQARVTPIHKKGSKTEASNYRPISLTSILCKLYEKIIRDRVFSSVGDKISQYQHGFVTSKSCLSNLLHAADFINSKLANEEPVDIFYLDFQKAFDSVPHDKLMIKLENMGLEKQLLAVIADFLSDRTFSVSIGDTLSAIKAVRSGVPQGSVLGPLLFVLYINDMPENIQNLLLLFADDAKVCANALNRSTNQDDLDKLADWQKRWGLTFNTIDNKCKVMHIGKNNPCNLYMLNDQHLQSTSEEKDLGVWMNSDYSWQTNIDNYIMKARSTMSWIMRVILNKNKNVMLQLYKSLVRPHLEYCVQLWSPKPRHGNWSLIFGIEDVQRDFTRQINDIGHLCYSERLKILNLTTLVERRARGDLIETFKIFKGIANYGQDLFRFSRSGYNILHPVGKRNTQQNDFFNTRVIDYWNKLPHFIKDSNNVDIFKARLEAYKRHSCNSNESITNFWSLSDVLLNKINDTNRAEHIDFLINNPEIAKHKMTNVYNLHVYY